MSYRHLPPDIQASLTRYEQRVRAGVIVPWDPDQPRVPEFDSWLKDWLATRLPVWFLEDN